METILKADIFFVVTTVCVVVLTLLVAVALLYLVAILRSIKRVADVARRELSGLAEDIHDVSTEIKEGVHDVRTSVNTGVKTAETLTRQATRSGGLVELLSLLVDTFIEARTARKGTARRRRTKKDA